MMNRDAQDAHAPPAPAAATDATTASGTLPAPAGALPEPRGQIADATAIPCAHCLRPAFAARIAAELDRGAAINLVAAPGQGAGRLLADLKALPEAGPRLVANLKRHRRHQPGLVADLWHQTGLAGEPPADLATLCDRLEQDAPETALLRTPASIRT
jgi:hypothetical protein